MLALYIGCAVVTVVLILISAFAGSHGHDADGGGDFSHSHDADHGATEGEDVSNTHGWMPWLSVRFWTYFFAGFGLIGLLCTLLSRIGQTECLAWAVAGGLIAGLGVSYAMRLAKKYESGLTLGAKDFEGKLARVLVSCGETKVGKIRLDLEGETIDMLARSQRAQTLEAGTTVVVVGVENDTALVISEGDLMK